MGKCSHCGEDHTDDLRFCPTTGKLFSPERFYPPGTLLEEKYRIGKVLGVGGIGLVFEGEHILLGKRVAIKLLLPLYARDREMTTRLIREARAASATGHRNIVSVTDMGIAEDGTLFMVMEYVAGRTLTELIRRDAPLSIERALGLIDQILAALEVVHKKGIIHRDLKPNNIITYTDDAGEETLKVLDFGISKFSDQAVDSDLTTIGRVMGTPKYMSPEQAMGVTALDHRADIYSCGAILYEMLTGKLPLIAKTFNEMITQLQQGVITPPSRLRPSIPAGVDQLVMQALSRSPGQRPLSASRLRSALRSFIQAQLESTNKGMGAILPPGAPRSTHDAPGFMDTSEPIEDASIPAGVPAARGGEAAPVEQVDTQVAAQEDGQEDGQEDATVQAPGKVPAPAAEARLEMDSVSIQPEAAGDKAVDHLAASSAPDEDRISLVELAAPISPRFSADEGGAGLELAEDPKSTLPTLDDGLDTRPVASSPGWLVRNLHTLIIVAVVGVGVTLAWRYREQLLGPSDAPTTDSVLLLVETRPREADVLVDGVLTVTRPIQLPRGERTFAITIRADGYFTRSLSVMGDRTQNLRVTLKKR